MNYSIFWSRRLTTALLAGTALMVCCAFAVAQEETSGTLEDSVDAALSIPQVMVVERIDEASRTIRLNGRDYHFPESADRPRLNLSVAGRLLEIDNISRGMEVMVITDGTEPRADRRPVIYAMWAR